MKSIFSWVSLIAGVLPGIAVILNGFGTPEELRIPFGVTASACGFVAFAVVLLINRYVKHGNKGTLALFIIASGFVGFVSLCLYWMVLEHCIFHTPGHSAAFFPLWLDGQAKVSIESAGGRLAYYENYGPGAVSKLLETQTDQLIRTKLLLLGLLSTASLTLSVAGGLASALLELLREERHDSDFKAR